MFSVAYHRIVGEMAAALTVAVLLLMAFLIIHRWPSIQSQNITPAYSDSHHVASPASVKNGFYGPFNGRLSWQVELRGRFRSSDCGTSKSQVELKGNVDANLYTHVRGIIRCLATAP